MYPIILERDTPIIDWRAYLAGWGTTSSDLRVQQLTVRSDGLLHVNFGTAEVSENTPVITTRLAASIGVHLTGPRAGDEYTPYAVSVVAWNAEVNVRAFAFIGESPSSITSAAAGNLVTDIRIVGLSKNAGGGGDSLELERTFIIKPNTVDRGVCFGVGIIAAGVNSGPLPAGARISVRRLIDLNPAIMDTRKL